MVSDQHEEPTSRVPRPDQERTERLPEADAQGRTERLPQGGDRTELIPQESEPHQPEPELITHRGHDLPPEPTSVQEPVAEEEPSEQERGLRRKKTWRRVRRIGYVVAGLAVLGPLVAFAITYFLVTVPDPRVVAASQSQTVTLYYANGDKMVDLAPEGNRTMITYSDIPDPVKHAVYAAEDASFEQNPGFDPKAIVRALWLQATGGQSGGSGITQQYIKQATGNDVASLGRKWTELVTAVKMSQQQSKQEILTSYLNTIYFGRRAYGIKAAAQAYFGKDLKDLNASEAAQLAGMIQGPSRSEDTTYRTKRWNDVMTQLVEKNWLSAADRAKFAEPPKLVDLEKTEPAALQGPRRAIQYQVMAELAGPQYGLSEEQVQRQGLKIYTTVDAKAQDAAEKAVQDVMSGQPANLRQALVAVNPKTGGVTAYWGNKEAGNFDYAQSLQQPGSAFKPFDLVAALEQGIGIGSRFDSTSPQKVDGVRDFVNASSSYPCQPMCTLKDAMLYSINTTFVNLVYNKVTTRAVADAAHQAGIPDEVDGKKLLVGASGGTPDLNIAIGGGETVVRTLDMAAAYATFAADGTKRAPHFVSKIVYPDGHAVERPDDGKPAFDGSDANRNQQIARNVTATLVDGASQWGLRLNGPWATGLKTGTQDLGTTDNSKAWTVGYTQTVSAAVWVGADKTEPIRDKDGKPIFGGGLPGKIWQQFMGNYLKAANIPNEPFPAAKPIGEQVQPTATFTTTHDSPPPPTNPTSDTTIPSAPSSSTTTTTTTPSRTTTPPKTIITEPGETGFPHP
ncbi:transglycosylase domain-containing protein [Kutzneria viridogrisea]